MSKVIIPKEMTQDDLIVIPRREYERLLSLRPMSLPDKESVVTQDDVLQWSQEARELKRKGALPALSSLKDLR